MQARPITDALTVCPQITPGDIADIAARGFASIICNRPDGEAEGQPSYDAIAAAAHAAGLQTAYQPITPGQCGPVQAAEFAKLTARLPGPIFAYCRTGTRSATLWALGELAAGRDPALIAADAARAGYDLAVALDSAARAAARAAD